MEKENSNSIFKTCLEKGLLLGVFWAIKSLVAIGASGNTTLSILSTFLLLGTPLLLFIFLRQLKQMLPNRKLTLWMGIKFSVFVFLLASIPEMIVQYARITWLEPDLLEKMVTTSIEALKSIGLSEETIDTIKGEATSMSSYKFLSSGMFSNMFTGGLLSIILTPFVIIIDSDSDKNTQD